MSDSLWFQHVRLSYRSVSPGACSNSCPLSWWCHPTISSSITPFSSSSFNLSYYQGLFQLVGSLHWGGQKIGASASTSVLQINIQDWFTLRPTGLISLQPKLISRVFSKTTAQKHQFFGTQPSLWFNSHIHTWLLEKPQLWLDGPLLAKWCLCFSICSLGWS